VSAQLPAQKQPVLPRQQEVEHDQVRRAAPQGLAHARAVRDRSDAQAVPLQVVAQQAPDLRVVVHDQDVVGRAHEQIMAHPPAGL
jgi:hypothetical protein